MCSQGKLENKKKAYTIKRKEGGTKMEKRKIQPTSIRLENELYEKIKADADRERRSITGQIEYMLLQYYEMRKLLLR